jgi:hypothetical protein
MEARAARFKVTARQPTRDAAMSNATTPASSSAARAHGVTAHDAAADLFQTVHGMLSPAQGAGPPGDRAPRRAARVGHDLCISDIKAHP